MTPHGPDLGAFESGSNADLQPVYSDDSMAIMFESRYVMQVTRDAYERPERQRDYQNCWRGLQKHFTGNP